MTDPVTIEPQKVSPEAAVPVAEPAYVITQEELDRLVGSVQAKASPDNKEVYEKAMAEARAEFEKAQNEKLESLARKADSERMARMEQEIILLREKANAPAYPTRKGVANTTNPFTKSEDGKQTGIRRDILEDGIRKYLNPNA